METKLEIKVGQIWQTYGGNVVKVVADDDHPDFPFDIEGDDTKYSVGRNGRVHGDLGYTDEHATDADLKRLVADDAADFTLWSGGSNPAPGKRVVVILRDGDTETAPSELWCWEHHDSASDLIAYKVVQRQPSEKANDQSLGARAIEAINEMLDCNFLAPLGSQDDVRARLNKLIAAEVATALDPLVSSDAAALIERGRREAHSEAIAIVHRLGSDALGLMLCAPGATRRTAETLIVVRRWVEKNSGSAPKAGRPDVRHLPSDTSEGGEP